MQTSNGYFLLDDCIYKIDLQSRRKEKHKYAYLMELFTGQVEDAVTYLYCDKLGGLGSTK
jgi:hypothetical protein